MASQGFEELEVYRLAAQLSDEVRAAVRRWDKGDQTRFLFIARGSAYELQYWTARAEARDLPCPKDAHQRANRIGRMLNGLINRLPRDARI